MTDVAAKPKPKKAGKPIWPKIPPGFVRSVLAGHSALGLAFAALIYLVCFSGTVAVYAREFERWENPHAPLLQSVEAAAVQRAAEAAQGEFGQPAEHAQIQLPTPELPRFVVTMDIGHGQTTQTWYADAAGRLVEHGEAAWTRFMTELHIYLHLPQSWGMFIVGLTGVALLSSLISGVLAHPRVFKDSFHLRWGGSKRLQEADLHNRMGVWALPFHVIVSLTGALLGLTTFVVGILAMVVFQGDMNRVYDMFLGPHPEDDPRSAPFIDLIGPLEEAQRRFPDAYPTYVGAEHPNERGQSLLIMVREPDRLSLGSNMTFNGAGEVIHVSRPEGSTLGERVFGVLGVLHFGWFGGWPIKIAYGILGFALTAVTSSGVAIWLARRRDKGRPAPRWERIWTATVWSQPIAFAASAIAALLVPAAPLVAIWLAATLASYAPALVWDPKALSRNLRATGGVLILAVVGIHVVQTLAAPADPVAWIVDAVLAGTALVLLISAFRRKPAAPVPAAA